MTQPGNVVHYLQQSAAHFGDRLALAAPAGGATISFADLWNRVDRTSTGLRAAGLKKGDRAICMVPMSIELYIILLAILKAGGIAVFVDPWIVTAQIAAFAAFAEPAAYIGIPKSHILRLLNSTLRKLPISVTTGSRLWQLPAGLTLAELMSKPGDGKIENAIPTDTALITFTSGSSGLPKGVNRTHGFLSSQHEALKSEFPAHAGDVDMPMFPVFALNNIALGISSVIPDMNFRQVACVTPSAILAQMNRFEVTTCTASPPFFNRLANHLAAAPTACTKLRRILTGGAPVSNDSLRAWTKVFPSTEIIIVYGSTEAEPVAHISADERIEAHNNIRPEYPGHCLGTPSPMISWKIIGIHNGPVVLDASGWSSIQVPSGEIGELVISGSHVGRDYYRNPAAFAANKILDTDGTVWHRMGDTVYSDSSGRLWLAGRVHSTIWRNRKPIHPQLVEQAIQAAGFPDCAALGCLDTNMGERLIAVISTETRPDTQALKAKLNKAGFPVDDIIVTGRSLPLDPRHNSKVDYNKLQKDLF